MPSRATSSMRRTMTEDAMTDEARQKETAKMTANPDYAHRQMMAAIKAISDGRRLDDAASVPSDYGREFKIRDALINGELEFSGPFEDDDWKVVLAAFGRLKLTALSRRKDECCATLLRAIGRA